MAGQRRERLIVRDDQQLVDQLVHGGEWSAAHSGIDQQRKCACQLRIHHQVMQHTRAAHAGPRFDHHVRTATGERLLPGARAACRARARDRRVGTPTR